MICTLTILGRLPGENEIIDAARGNKYKAAGLKKEYTEMVAWQAKSAKIPSFKKIDVTFTWYEPNRKRDKDNIMAGQKFIFDGLVTARIISNDGWNQVGDVMHKFRVDQVNPRVEVEIKEIGEVNNG